MKAFNVYLNGKLIDTIYYSDSSDERVEDVIRSLVNHDGYDPSIKVRKVPADRSARTEAQRDARDLRKADRQRREGRS